MLNSENQFGNTVTFCNLHMKYQRKLDKLVSSQFWRVKEPCLKYSIRIRHRYLKFFHLRHGHTVHQILEFWILIDDHFDWEIVFWVSLDQKRSWQVWSLALKYKIAKTEKKIINWSTFWRNPWRFLKLESCKCCQLSWFYG